MKIRPSIPSCFLLCLLAAPSVAFADAIWFWSFDQTEYVVSSSDSVVLHATLFNSPLSTESLTRASVPASFTGDLQKVYDFTFGPTGNSSEFFFQFEGLNVEPGASFPFVVGILTPIGGSAPVGIHPFCCEAHLTFGSDTTLESQAPVNTFQIRVPEPPLVGLLGAGMLAFLSVHRRVRRFALVGRSRARASTRARHDGHEGVR
jgi:hypothetical protein